MLLSIIGLPTYNGPGMTRISITMKHGKENDRTGDCSESPCKAWGIEWRSCYPIVVELPCSTTPSPGQSSTNTEYSAALPGQRLGLVQSEGYYYPYEVRSTPYSIATTRITRGWQRSALSAWDYACQSRCLALIGDEWVSYPSNRILCLPKKRLMGSVMRRLGHIHWLWTPGMGNGWSASPPFCALWLGKTRRLPAKSLAPGIRTDTGSSPHEETREHWLNFRIRTSLFQGHYAYFRSRRCNMTHSHHLPLLATHIWVLRVNYVWCDYWYSCSFPARPWFHHRETLQKIDGELLWHWLL